MNIGYILGFCPVGFEVDRIVLPAIRKKADRVWLITDKPSHQDKGSSYAEELKRG